MNTITCLCPFCGKGIDEGLPILPKKTIPKENNVAVCANCLGLLQFNTDLTVRKCDPEVYADIVRTPEKKFFIDMYRALIQAAKEMNQQNGKPGKEV